MGVVYPGSGGGQRVSGDAICGDISSEFYNFLIIGCLFLIWSYSFEF